MGDLTLGFDAVYAAAVFPTALLVACRLLPLAFVAPWLAISGFPLVIRIGSLLAVTAALTPLALSSAPEIPDGFALIPWCARELLVGLAFAVAAHAPLFGLKWGGQLVDSARGVRLPTTGDGGGAMGNLYLYLGLAIFVSLGGLRLVFASLGHSFVDLPVGAAGVSGSAFLGAAALVGHALSLAVSVAVPAFATILVLEAGLAVWMRVVPQVPAHFLGAPARASLGLVGALVAFSLLAGSLVPSFREAILSAARILTGV